MDANRYLNLIAALPQAPLISEETAMKWIERTLKIDPQRIEWHIRRAGGFGGSDIPGLVATLDRKPTRFSAHRTVKQKLLLLSPDRGDEHTKRGTELEEHARSRFEAELTARDLNWRRRHDVETAISCTLNPDHPWMRASVDGVYEIDGMVYIVDFKVPMPDVLDGYVRTEGFEDYRAQLHHYRLDAVAKGIGIDGLALACYRFRDNGCEIFEIDHDPVLDARILDAGDLYWNRFVLRGEVPDLDLPDFAVPEDGVPPEVEEAAERFVFFKIAELNAKKRAEAAREEVEAFVKRTGRLGRAVFPACGGFMQVSAKPVLDCEAAAARLRDLGTTEERIDAMRGAAKYDPKKVSEYLDGLLRGPIRDVLAAAQEGGDALAAAVAALGDAVLEAPLKEKGDLDPVRMREALVVCNEDPEFFMVERLSSALPKSKNTALDERKALIEQELSELSIRAFRDEPVEERHEEQIPRAVP